MIELVEWPIFCINLSKAFFTKNAWPSERILYVVSHMPCIAVGCQSRHDAYPLFSRSLLETPGTNWFPFNVHKRMFKGAVSWQLVQFILFNFANYSPSIAMELKVSTEITCKWQNQRCKTNKYVYLALFLKLQAAGINFEKLLGWTVFKNPNFNPFQSSSVFPIHDICCFCYVILSFI